MTRNLKGSLLIASMLVVWWTTSSEACHWRRRACQPTPSYCQSGYSYASPTGYYSSAQGGYVTTGGGYYDGGTAGYSGGYGYGQTGYGQTGYGYDSRPARLQPGRPRWAGVRDRGAAAWRRRLRPGALTVQRFSDYSAGRAGQSLRAHSEGLGRSQRMGPRPVRRFVHQ